MEARVADVRSTHMRGRSALQDSIVIKVVVVNAGNRPAVFLAPWYQIADTPNYHNGAMGGEVANWEDFPMLYNHMISNWWMYI